MLTNGSLTWYIKKTADSVKDYVVKSLMNEESHLRIVIATKVVGLGIDVRCDLVVNYGPPATVDDYLQQIGRAGRGGQQSRAVMLYSAQQLRNVEAGMLNVLKYKEKCIRELCLQEFEQKKATFEPPHLCCGFCASECQCGSCGLDQNSFETFTSTQELEEDSDGEQFIRTVTPDNDHDLLRELTALKEELDRET